MKAKESKELLISIIMALSILAVILFGTLIVVIGERNRLQDELDVQMGNYQLRECPLCGKEVELEEGTVLPSIECKYCRFHVFAHYDEETIDLINRWNRRAGE